MGIQTYPGGDIRGGAPVGTVLDGGSYITAADTITTTGLSEVWLNSTATIGVNPIRRCMVMGLLDHSVISTNTTPSIGALTGVQISIDGGASYSSGSTDRFTFANLTLASYRWSGACQHHVMGTPTGSIKIRAYIQQNSGVAGDVTWDDFNLVWMIYAM